MIIGRVAKRDHFRRLDLAGTITFVIGLTGLVYGISRGGISVAGGRQPGAHRTYAEADVERLTELLRPKDLLGPSLEELKELVEAEGARAALLREAELTPG